MSTRTYTVRAVRWAGGWELHIDDVGVTQSRTLATPRARYMTRLTDHRKHAGLTQAQLAAATG